MAGFFISLFGLGVFGAILVVLGVVGLFAISAITCTMIKVLFDDLNRPLGLEGSEFLIFTLVVAIVLIIISELGPVSRVIGKTYIMSQLGFAIFSLICMFNRNFDKYIMSLYIAITIVVLIVNIFSTDFFLEFLQESPILSILSAIPASFFVFVYIWFVKEETSNIDNMVILAKESLIITLIIFGIFTAIEIVNLIKNK